MFPYRGSIFLCPGRNFAKLEIMAAILFMVFGFRFEALSYLKDGWESFRQGAGEWMSDLQGQESRRRIGI